MGVVSIDAQPDDLIEIPISVASTGDNVIVAAVPGLVVRLYRLDITVSANTNLTIKNGSTIVRGPYYMLANGSIVLDFSGRPWITCSENTNLVINSSAATASIGGGISYKQNAPSPV